MELMKEPKTIVVTKTMKNNWGSILFIKGDILETVHDMGSCYLAKVKGSDDTPRMIYKDQCEEIAK